jgi:two-component system response regulator ArlR
MKNILIVEDEPDLIEILQMIIEEGGFNCLIADCGAKAWSIFQNEKIDAILSDKNMPNMNGIELLKKVRSLSNIPFYLFISDDSFEKHLIEIGASGILSKPYDSKQIIACLDFS